MLPVYFPAARYGPDGATPVREGLHRRLYRFSVISTLCSIDSNLYADYNMHAWTVAVSVMTCPGFGAYPAYSHPDGIVQFSPVLPCSEADHSISPRPRYPPLRLPFRRSSACAQRHIVVGLPARLTRPAPDRKRQEVAPLMTRRLMFCNAFVISVRGELSLAFILPAQE
jgi:hypothetical protein